jgi:hypothetical protein
VIDRCEKSPSGKGEKRLKTGLSAVSYRIEKEAIHQITMANRLTGAEEKQADIIERSSLRKTWTKPRTKCHLAHRSSWQRAPSDSPVA